MTRSVHVLLLALALALPVALAGCGGEEPGVVDRARSFAAGFGTFAPVVYIVCHALLVVVMFPNAALSLGAGAAFGFPGGWAVAQLGAVTGTAIAMALSRTLLRSQVERWLKRRPKLAGLDRALANGGVKLVVLARLSPAIPFAVLNYILGLTGMPFVRCWAASAVASVLGTFLYSYAGATAVDITRAPKGSAAAGVVGIAITVAFVWLITRLAKKEMAKANAEPLPDAAPSPSAPPPPAPTAPRS